MRCHHPLQELPRPLLRPLGEGEWAEGEAKQHVRGVLAEGVGELLHHRAATGAQEPPQCRR